ncbi:MAG: outer membrane beta-barrel protein [Paracoccaceae bacterium]
MRKLLLATAMVTMIPGLALAEDQLSFYGGVQGSPHSGVSGRDPGGVGAFDFTAGWEGRSFETPPYWGFRWTRWQNDTFGWGVDVNHTKVYADDQTLAESGFSHFEFSDGLNIVTLNAWRRFPDTNMPFTPYVGAGVGLSIPHVEVTSPGGKVFEYQITGPAVQWVAGASYSINDRWSVFGEYKGTYSMNDADLGSGGTLQTDIITNAFNIGVSLGF